MRSARSICSSTTRPISSVDTSQSTLAILPLRPLAEKTSYMVVITDDLGGSQTVSTDTVGDYLATVPAGTTTADVEQERGLRVLV